MNTIRFLKKDGKRYKLADKKRLTKMTSRDGVGTDIDTREIRHKAVEV